MKKLYFNISSEEREFLDDVDCAPLSVFNKKWLGPSSSIGLVSVTNIGTSKGYRAQIESHIPHVDGNVEFAGKNNIVVIDSAGNERKAEFTVKENIIKQIPIYLDGLVVYVSVKKESFLSRLFAKYFGG